MSDSRAETVSEVVPHDQVITKKVNDRVEEAILVKAAELADADRASFTVDTPLLGEGGHLDSLKLVRLCLELEDLAENDGFNFDWTSDIVLSRSRSFLRSARTLADEYRAQRQAACP